MKNNLSCKIILLALIFSSCQLEKIIEIDRSNELIVLDATWNGGYVSTVRLQHSTFIQDSVHSTNKKNLTDKENQFYATVNNATIHLFENNVLIDELLPVSFDEDYLYDYLQDIYRTFYSPKNIVPNTTKEYRLEILVDGYEPLSAIATPMNPIELLDYYFNPEETQNGYYGWVEFLDPPDEKNYYEFDIIRPFSNKWNRYNPSIPIYCDSLAEGCLRPYNTFDRLRLTYVNGISDFNYFAAEYSVEEALILNDENFDGQKTRIEFYNDNPWPNLVKTNMKPIEDSSLAHNPYSYTALRLKHISKEHYTYKFGVQKQVEISEDPFAEPYFIESNVTGGLGLFSIYSESIIYLKDKDAPYE